MAFASKDLSVLAYCNTSLRMINKEKRDKAVYDGI